MHRLSALRARTDLWIAPPVLGKYVQIGVPLLPEVSAAWRPTSSSVHGQSDNSDYVVTFIVVHEGEHMSRKARESL